MKKYDLIVVGGGFAGVGAAVSAAREGVKTLLIDKTNALSGAANFGLVLPFMPNRTRVTDAEGESYMKELSGGVFTEITNALKETDNGGRDVFDNEYLKLLLNRMCTDAGVELLFNATVIDAERKGNSIRSVTVFSRGQTERLEADYFIDATGDANLVAMAGFPFRVGRETDGLCQPMTLCFRVAGVDIKAFHQIHNGRVKSLIQDKYKKFKAEGKIKNPREDILVFSVMGINDNTMLHFNTTRVAKCNPCDMFEVTKAEIEAREQAFELLDFLKSNFECFKNARVVSSGMEIGIRESRMIDGEYMLTGTEIIKCPKFEDSVAVCNYDIDIHNPEGEGTSHYFFPQGEYYEIPYRTLIPKNAENLLVAGRCISADHEAQASVRIMPTVCTLGQAAGTAVAVAKSQSCNVKDVNIENLQKLLTDNGAVIH